MFGSRLNQVPLESNYVSAITIAKWTVRIITLSMATVVIAAAAYATQPPPNTPAAFVPPPSAHQLEWLAHLGQPLPKPQLPIGNTAEVSLSTTSSTLTRTVFGFMPYWQVSDLSHVHWNLLSHVAYFSVTLNSDGSITNLSGSTAWPSGSYVAALRNAAHTNGVKVVLTANNFTSSSITTLLSTSAYRQNAINNLKALVQGYGDGVNIDLEGVSSTQKANLVTFMTGLTAAFHSAIPGSHVTVCTPAIDWSGAFDYDQLAINSDGLFIMGYDYHWSSATQAGPVAPLTSGSIWDYHNVTWTVNDYLTWGGSANRAKFILGVPYYGYEWPTASSIVPSSTTGTGSSKTYSNARANASTYGRLWDSASQTPYYIYNSAGVHQGWYDDAESLGYKWDLVNSNDLGGTGIWALNYDTADDQLWNQLQSKFGGGGTLPDLAVTSWSAPTSGTIGGQVTVSATVTNRGSGSSGAYRLGFYFSTDSTITTSDTYSGSACNMSALSPGSSQVCSGPINIPSSLAQGTYYIGALADDLGSVNESNEGNNAATSPISLSTSTYTIALSASPSAGGTLTGAGTFAAGSTRTVSASANNGYTFSSWTENGAVVSSSSSYTFTLTANRTLVANFVVPSYTITVSASPNTGGTVSGGGTFAAGTSCTVSASANSGYTFSNWTEGGIAVSSSLSYTFTLNTNRVLVANFSTISTGTINVTATLNGSAWSGLLSFQLNGPSSSAGTSVPTTIYSAPAGSYAISYQSGGPGGAPSIASQTQTLSGGGVVTFNFAFTSTSLPNLIPYQPAGWAAPIVLAKTAGTSTDTSTFGVADSIYVDFAIANIGAGSTAATFDIDLLVDGTVVAEWYADPPWDSGSWGTLTDYVLAPLVAGRHTISILVDPTNTISESNEVDNQFTRTIIVGGSTAHDFDADAKSDIIWRNAAAGDTVMWLMNGGTIASSRYIANLPSSWAIAATTDFNNDGRSDIVWRDSSTGDTVLWVMNGGTMVASRYLGNVPPPWAVATAADFDGDGNADIIWRNGNTGDTVMWLMSGGSPIASRYLGNLPSAWTIAATGDFDADGKYDLVWRNGNTGETVMWLMNGSTLISSRSIGVLPTSWTIATAGDFDGDARCDLIWRNAGTGDTVIWFMNGTTMSSSRYMANLPASWAIAAAGDFDGDSRCDLIWRNASTGDTVMWLMNGSSYSASRYLVNLPSSWKMETKP